MQEFYYELLVKSGSADVLREFVFELGVSAVEEVAGGFVVRDDESLENLRFALEALCERLGVEAEFSLETRQNRDWIEEYKRSVKPVRAGAFFVRPSWEAGESGLVDVVIDPALAFGSGHHESTNMCLRLISKHFSGGLASDFASENLANSNLNSSNLSRKNAGKTALDVGCGSGILSIALAKFGWEVSACDTDALAVCSTGENAAKNGVKLVQIWEGSVTSHEKVGEKTFDLVVANIIADVILMLSNDLKFRIKPHGHLLLSGILSRYKTRILEEFAEFRLVENLSEGEWESFLFERV